ncbi:MAG: hypothetical protein AAFZ11_10735 [Pseudomonadota bacterium]
MSTTRPFEPVGKQRFTIEWIGREQWIVARATRSWFMLPFFSLWLLFWTLGGVAAVATLLSEPHLFIALWLVGWALGWVYVAVTIAWQLTGKSQVTIANGSLVHGWSMVFFKRAKRYDVTRITDIRPAVFSHTPLGYNAMMSFPPFLPGIRGMRGSVLFDYGGRTNSIMNGLDEAEGKAIALWLNERMPAILAESAA